MKKIVLCSKPDGRFQKRLKRLLGIVSPSDAFRKPLKPKCEEHDREDYFTNVFKCPVCDQFLASYSFGRAWTNNGLAREHRNNCKHCGTPLDWSDVPFPDKEAKG